MQELWKWANLTVAFAVELGALVVLGLWGWRAGDSTVMKVILALGIPLAAAVAWGMFAAPKASFDIPLLAVITKVVVFGGAAAALWGLGHRVAAVVFAGVVIANLLAIKLGHLNS
ncbi:YrdB family protein [Nocardia aobensis]|uniref:YrdB family protein n=1 Tax=Nocardia aobensis TaxID=257277 RepID=UPI0002FEBECC|nr:YrdB family protein [Nocardia aobensis]